MAVIVGVVCACVFCWVALSVLSWHAKVEEELVVCEILSTTTNLFMGLSYERCFFFDDMQNEKNLRALLTITNLWTCKLQNIWEPFWLQHIYGMSYKQFFFYDMQNENKIESPLQLTLHLMDWDYWTWDKGSKWCPKWV
jgi:hypothetical protein